MKSRIALYLIAGTLTLTSCQRSAVQAHSPLPFGSVDLPAPKTAVKGQIQVAGWALSEQPIHSVTLYVDRKYMGEASSSIERPDVAAANPTYTDAAKSGWLITLDTMFLAPGWHDLVVQAKTESGVTRDLSTVPVLVQR